MPNKYTISVPTPCHEDWQQMTRDQKCRFCGSCQTNVVDFTTSSDNEIAKQLSSGDVLCGRFLNRQLDRTLTPPTKKSGAWMATASGVVALLASTEQMYSQVSPPNVYTSENYHDARFGKYVVTEVTTRTITGTVVDSIGPLPGAHVLLKETTISTQTDSNGHFAIDAKPGDILTVHFVGMADSQHTVSENSSDISVIMNESTCITTGVIVTTRQRSFTGRFFSSIKRLFR